MASTYLDLHVHIVFATKNRQPLIKDEWQDRLYAFLGGTVRSLSAKAIAIGGTADHVHLLIELKATHTVAEIAREIKKSSSVWVKTELGFPNFGWQEGYAAFSVSAGLRQTVVDYITNQKEHHKRINAFDELRQLLAEAGVEYDGRFFE